mmetsp:Transcript_75627/g.167441  ORF Transcript_75627/g.167441 Transcript_75627/m.167441 type:complete len:242 (+) Transcript_75627:194-919(+)
MVEPAFATALRLGVSWHDFGTHTSCVLIFAPVMVQMSVLFCLMQSAFNLSCNAAASVFTFVQAGKLSFPLGQDNMTFSAIPPAWASVFMMCPVKSFLHCAVIAPVNCLMGAIEVWRSPTCSGKCWENISSSSSVNGRPAADSAVAWMSALMLSSPPATAVGAAPWAGISTTSASAAQAAKPKVAKPARRRHETGTGAVTSSDPPSSATSRSSSSATFAYTMGGDWGNQYWQTSKGLDAKCY